MYVHIHVHTLYIQKIETHAYTVKLNYDLNNSNNTFVCLRASLFIIIQCFYTFMFLCTNLIINFVLHKPQQKLNRNPGSEIMFTILPL